MTHNDLTIADHRPDVAFALSRENSAASSAILAKMQGLYQVPVDLASDHFGCPSAIHAEFVAQENLGFARIDAGGGMDEDLEHLSGLLAEWYERVRVLEIKHTANAVPREQAKRSSVERLLLGVAERVVTWSDNDVGRTSRSERVFDGFCNA